MSYFIEQLDFLIGGRLTTIEHMTLRLWPDELDHETVLLGSFVSLPPGQDVDVEADFLGSHLPLHRASFGGRDAEDEPWLFAIQAVPRSVISDVFGGDADPFETMRNAVVSALVYNYGARFDDDWEWDRVDLVDIYADAEVDPSRVVQWTTFELLRGLLAELTGIALVDLVAGYPNSCAFEDRPHQCQHDVFEDAFHAWTEGVQG